MKILKSYEIFEFLNVMNILKSFEILWTFLLLFNFWNFKFFYHFEFFGKFWNLMKFLKFYENLDFFFLILEISNFMRFSNILISKKQFLCNKKPYRTLVPRNFIHWICMRVQYAFLLHRNCFLLINMLENGMSRVLVLANRKTVK